MNKDIVIIGNGPAGLSAAIYALRANMQTIVIGKDNGSLDKAEKIENYFGILRSPTGRELIEAGKEQVKNFGGTILDEEVFGIDWDGDFTIKLRDNEFKAKSVILATGSARKTINIPGIQEYEGRGISYCAVCDGFFYKDKDVALLGSGEYAIHEAKELENIVKSITVLTNGDKAENIKFPEQYTVEMRKIKNFSGTDSLSSVHFEDGKSINIDGLFIALGSASAVDLARKVGAVTQNNIIEVNNNMETNIPGLFAAGDCIGGVQQVSVAVGEGAKAALTAIKYVRGAK